MKGKRFISALLTFVLLIVGSNCVPILANAIDQSTALIEDGVYYIQNKYSGNYLTVQDYSISENANVVHCAVDIEADYLPSMWKIHYVGNGVYSIRPMHKLDMALSCMLEDAVIRNVGTNDTLTGVAVNALWYIEESELGYYITSYVLSNRTLFAENTLKEMYPDTLLTDYEPELLHCHWELQKVEEPPEGVILYQNGSITPDLEIPILRGQTIALSDLGVVPAAYSGDTISQDFQWTSSNPDIISVNPETGAVTGISNGAVQIIGTSADEYTITYDVRVKKAFTMGTEYMGGYTPDEDLQFGLNTSNAWNNCGYDATFEPYADPEKLYYGFLNSDIVFIIGHGSQHVISIQDRLFITDETVPMTSTSMQISAFNFSNVKLCVYNSCETICDKDFTGLNVCEATLQAGVECVVGWEEKIYFNDCVPWQQRFQQRLSMGYSVEDAAAYANSFLYSDVFVSSNSPIKNLRILGNEELKIVETSVVDDVYDPYYIDFIAEGYTGIECNPNLYHQYIAEYFGNAFIEQHQTMITNTSDDGDDYVLDVVYDKGITSGKLMGYTIVVRDNQIIAMRDNTHSVTTYATENEEIIVVHSLEEAYATSSAKLAAASSEYILDEQEAYFFQSNDPNVSFYRVYTTYMTADGTYGAFSTLYQLNNEGCA